MNSRIYEFDKIYTQVILYLNIIRNPIPATGMVLGASLTVPFSTAYHRQIKKSQFQSSLFTEKLPLFDFQKNCEQFPSIFLLNIRSRLFIFQNRMISAYASASLPLQTAVSTSHLDHPSSHHLPLLSSLAFLSSPGPRLSSASSSSPDRISRLSRMDWIRRMTGGCLKDTAGKQHLKVEADSGGEDIFNAAPSYPPRHLVIMVNGLTGRFDY